MRTLIIAISLFLSIPVLAQKQDRFVSLAVTNHHAAYPFAAFANLFAKEFHPGFEAGYGFNWKTRTKSDWFQAFRVGYFYHRFVQHALPVYTQVGYRYKPVASIRLTAALGAGYLHSIPATAVYELEEGGQYKNAKGLGRGQVMLTVAGGAHYIVNQKSQKPITLFIEYQQQLQTPFIKSYVPLLPYNSIALGCTFPLIPKN